MVSPAPSFADAAVQSSQWYAWGPPNMQCRLCASCWNYWKKYGGLKTPTHLDGTARAGSVSRRGSSSAVEAPDFELEDKMFHKTWHLPSRNENPFHAVYLPCTKKKKNLKTLMALCGLSSHHSMTRQAAIIVFFSVLVWFFFSALSGTDLSSGIGFLLPSGCFRCLHVPALSK